MLRHLIVLGLIPCFKPMNETTKYRANTSVCQMCSLVPLCMLVDSFSSSLVCRMVVNAFLVITHFGYGAVYFVFAGNTLFQVSGGFVEHYIYKYSTHATDIFTLIFHAPFNISHVI